MSLTKESASLWNGYPMDSASLAPGGLLHLIKHSFTGVYATTSWVYAKSRQHAFMPPIYEQRCIRFCFTGCQSVRFLMLQPVTVTVSTLDKGDEGYALYGLVLDVIPIRNDGWQGMVVAVEVHTIPHYPLDWLTAELWNEPPRDSIIIQPHGFLYEGYRPDITNYNQGIRVVEMERHYDEVDDTDHYRALIAQLPLELELPPPHVYPSIIFDPEPRMTFPIAPPSVAPLRTISLQPPPIQHPAPPQIEEYSRRKVPNEQEAMVVKVQGSVEKSKKVTGGGSRQKKYRRKAKAIKEGPTVPNRDRKLKKDDSYVPGPSQQK
jgi:hypothetical protein